MVIPILLGGILGTRLLIHVSTSFIKYSVVAAMIAVLLHTYITRSKPTPETVSKKSYAVLAVFLFFIGVYTNFIGIGEGTFSKVGLMSLLGFTFIQSQGIKSTATMPTRMYSLIVTALAGLIVWPYLLTKWCSNFIAGKYSTKFVKRVPDIHMQRAMTAFSIVFIIYLLLFYK